VVKVSRLLSARDRDVAARELTTCCFDIRVENFLASAQNRDTPAATLTGPRNCLCFPEHGAEQVALVLGYGEFRDRTVRQLCFPGIRIPFPRDEAEE
jgi:hypothetical protein